MSRGASRTLTWLLVALAACRRYDYETEHLKITLVGDDRPPLCEGDLLYYEEQIELIENTLGVRLKQSIKVELEASAGGPPAGGEYHRVRRKITTSRHSMVHELVHAVAADLGDPDPFYGEGAAEALDGTTKLFPIAVSLPSENLGVAPDYAVAGHFFRWLMAQHGNTAAVELLRGQSFSAAVGGSMTDQEREWLDAAPWAYPPLDDCPYASLNETEDGWRGEVSLSCGDPGVTTFDGVAHGSRLACRRFEVLRAGLYEVETEGRGTLKRCMTDIVELPQVIDVERLETLEAGVYNHGPIPPPNDSAFFEPGEYAVCFQEPQDEVVSIEITQTGTTAVRP